MSKCNFQCSYCYLSQRDEAYQGKQAIFKYSPEYVGKAFSKERLGGSCFFNFCANGETLLTKKIDEYIHAIVSQGHYAEIVTNLSITSALDKILSWDQPLLKRVEFKCSFHYAELMKRNLLQVFADNVQKIWKAGCSANIEMVAADEFISNIDEIKEFSLKNFGALPHVTIARNDATPNIDLLTSLPIEEYDAIWSTFNSDFWQFKKSIFQEERKEFCYAGKWSLYVNLTTGDTTQCYCSWFNQNIYKDLKKDIIFNPIGKCLLPHCYNGHALLTSGCIPKFTDIGYGDIRDRKKNDGSHWLQPEICSYMNSKLEQSNEEIGEKEKTSVYFNSMIGNAKWQIKEKAKLISLLIKSKKKI